jgi:hypothetical protein
MWAKNTLWACPCLSVCTFVTFSCGIGNLHDRDVITVQQWKPLVPIVVTHWCTTMGREIIAGTYCCTTTSDHISARMTFGTAMCSGHISASMVCVIQCKEHLWNIIALPKNTPFQFCFLCSSIPCVTAGVFLPDQNCVLSHCCLQCTMLEIPDLTPAKLSTVEGLVAWWCFCVVM